MHQRIYEQEKRADKRQQRAVSYLKEDNVHGVVLHCDYIRYVCNLKKVTGRFKEI